MKNLNWLTNYYTFPNFAKNKTDMSLTIGIGIKIGRRPIPRLEPLAGLMQEVEKTNEDVKEEQTPITETVEPINATESTA